jgi:hypothetical protein
MKERDLPVDSPNSGSSHGLLLPNRASDFHGTGNEVLGIPRGHAEPSHR